MKESAIDTGKSAIDNFVNAIVSWQKCHRFEAEKVTEEQR